MKMLCPQCICTVELAQRIPEVLERRGFSTSAREPRPGPHGETAAFDYIVSDGVRSAHLLGVAHKEKMIVVLGRVAFGWKVHGLFGREKFASSVIECLLTEGAMKPPPPDEAKLRLLAERGDRGAKILLNELSREKRKRA